jgi:hypothetical protein
MSHHIPHSAGDAITHVLFDYFLSSMLSTMVRGSKPIQASYVQAVPKFPSLQYWVSEHFLNFVACRLCDLVVRVPGYRSRGPNSIPGATRLSEK